MDFQVSFEFVELKDLNSAEKAVFEKTELILDLVGWSSDKPEVRISETMRPESDSKALDDWFSTMLSDVGMRCQERLQFDEIN